MGQPDPERIYTSIVERSNLSTRMALRRFMRLTNAFSKKWENHWAAIVVWFTFYDFCRVHKSIKVTPAMEAGIADHICARTTGGCVIRWLPGLQRPPPLSGSEQSRPFSVTIKAMDEPKLVKALIGFGVFVLWMLFQLWQ